MERVPLLVALVVAFLFDPGRAYHTYYLEQECAANGTALLSLGGRGPESSFLLHSSPKPSYSMGLSCRVRVTSPPGHHVTLSVRMVDFKTRWDGSCEDYVTIRRIHYCRRVYREDEERHFDSSDDPVSPSSVEFFYRTSGNNATPTGFQGLQFTLTAFTISSGGGGVSSNESFPCANGHVVWSALQCDGHNNCGDMSDEDEYGEAQCGGGGGPDVLIVLGGIILFLLLVMCGTTLLCTKNERVRRFSTRVRTRTLSFLRQHRNSAAIM